MLGHKDYLTTQIYAKVLEKKVAQLNNTLFSQETSVIHGKQCREEGYIITTNKPII